MMTVTLVANAITAVFARLVPIATETEIVSNVLQVNEILYGDLDKPKSGVPN